MRAKLAEQYQVSLAVEYDNGISQYSVMGEFKDGINPVVLVPGFMAGRVALQNFAEYLAMEGGRLVIVPEQPSWFKGNGVPKDPLIHQADALLSVIYDMDFSKKPLDFVSHSFGALTLATAAKTAKDNGWTCFDSEKSQSVMISPAGSFDGETLGHLIKRWTRLMRKHAPETHGTRTSREILWAGPKNAFKQPNKTIKEIDAISKVKLPYEHLGQIGLKPMVLTYSHDTMIPEELITPTVTANLEHLSGYATVIGQRLDVPAADFKEYRAKSGWRKKAAKTKWRRHYLNANHPDLLYVPERTGKAVLQILDNLHALQEREELAGSYN